MINDVTGGNYVITAPNNLIDVRKYTAGSFYNWEQDNIPINDLETRTTTLGASIGLMSSSIPGATLVLSSSTDASLATYDNIEDIIALIPRVLTFPILVEICAYGNLGDLNLEGISAVGNGKLQFLNRNHAAVRRQDYLRFPKHNSISTITGFPWGDLLQSASTSSIDLYDQISAATSSRRELSCYDRASWNSYGRVFHAGRTSTQGTFNEPTFLAGSPNLIETSTATDHIFSGISYGPLQDASIAYDANPKEFGATASGVSYRDHTNSLAYFTYKPVVGNEVNPIYAYGNYFKSITVENCRGVQIQFKGICADGVMESSVAPNLLHDRSNGFYIRNSDVILTSCASFRNHFNGFRIKDSNVKIERGIVGYRNYHLAVADDRRLASYDWPAGIGFHATRSSIWFDTSQSKNTTTKLWDNRATDVRSQGRFSSMMMCNGGHGWMLTDCKVDGGVGGHQDTYTSTDSYGNPSSHDQGAGSGDYSTTQLISAFNKLDGFHIRDSTVLYRGIVRAQSNESDGVNIGNSIYGTMGTHAEFNNDIGIHLNSSKFTYNYGAELFFGKTGEYGYDLDTSNVYTRAGHSRYTPAVCVNANSKHNIKVTNNSSFSDANLEHSGRRAGTVGGRSTVSLVLAPMWSFNGQILDEANVNFLELGNLPLVEVSNNSYARFLGFCAMGDTYMSLPTHWGSGTVFPKYNSGHHFPGPVKGRALSVTDNSKVDLYGTSAFNTSISLNYPINSVNEIKNSWTQSALYAGQNSSIRIAGPTKISNFGVAALAEDNSKIYIGEALDSHGKPLKALDPLDLSGHSQVELHATRACLVANNNSTLEMIKCGAHAGVAGTTNHVDYALGNGTHAASFIQFYPNAFTEQIIDAAGGKHSDQNFTNKLALPGKFLRTKPGLDDATTPNRTLHNEVSTGGMCVRAVGGSKVHVDQVNFAVHMPTSDLSGAYYNLDGSGNEGIGVYTGSGSVAPTAESLGSATNHYAGSQIFMWNIADNSRIVASNLKVNSLDPSAAGYHGPDGRWGIPVDTVGQTSFGPLDYYGITGAYHAEAGKSDVHYNHGPFRLMSGTSSDLMTYGELIDIDNDAIVSENGTNSLTLGGTAIQQLNAQGYAAPGIGASSITGADYRDHSKIENQRTIRAGYIRSYGQPIFGGRPGTNVSATNVVGSDRRFLANSMVEDMHLSPIADIWGSTASSGILQGVFPNFPIPPIHMEWQGYLRNFLDESAGDTFANAKHGASKMVKLCSIFRSNTNPLKGGEGRDGSGDYTYGLGVRSLNMFDLNKLI